MSTMPFRRDAAEGDRFVFQFAFFPEMSRSGRSAGAGAIAQAVTDEIDFSIDRRQRFYAPAHLLTRAE